MDNKYYDPDDNDFGFSTGNVSSDIQTDTPELEDLKKRLKTIRKIYLPMLTKLAENPDNELIRWPNRKDILEKQIKKLMSLTDVT